VSDALLAWAVVVPLIAGAVSAFLTWAQSFGRTPQSLKGWLDIAALAILVLGLLAEGLLLLFMGGTSTWLGVTLAITPPARVALVAANVSLLCCVFFAWGGGDDGTESAIRPWATLPPMVVSSLLAAALLAQDRAIAVVCLLVVAAVVAGAALGRPRTVLLQGQDDEALSRVAKRMSGGLKHLSLAVLGTGVLLVGILLLARYSANLENRGLLQLALGLVAAGLAVRVGAMPFSAPASDMISAAPGAAIMMLGAATPAVLVAGLLVLAPVEGSLVPAASAEWLGAVGALLAGLRALAAIREGRGAQVYPTLLGAAILLQVAWALFGVLSGSMAGATGAVLLAANLSLAVPLVVITSRNYPGVSPPNRRLLRLGLAVGAISLLGLPPFGGFTGTLLVAQAATNSNGLWLAMLLSGSALAAAACLAVGANAPKSKQPPPDTTTTMRPRLASPIPLLICILIAAQLTLFLASGQLSSILAAWAGIPWITAP
jgi:multicomponent Na+:H+ antiporter subunit D